MTTNAAAAHPDLLKAARDLNQQVRELSIAVAAHAAALGEARSQALADFRALVADDACAVSYQSFGQYRTMLLRAIDQAGTTTTTKETADARDDRAQ